jgi:hypothetical protein
VFPCSVLARRGTSRCLARNRLEHNRNRVDAFCCRAIEISVIFKVSRLEGEGRPSTAQQTKDESAASGSRVRGSTAVHTYLGRFYSRDYSRDGALGLAGCLSVSIVLSPPIVLGAQ